MCASPQDACARVDHVQSNADIAAELIRRTLAAAGRIDWIMADELYGENKGVGSLKFA